MELKLNDSQIAITNGMIKITSPKIKIRECANTPE